MNSGAPRSLAMNAFIVGLAFLASRVLGMVREIVIAARFGTGETYDAYIAAFRIPDMVFVIVMSGAFGSAFIPVFGGYIANGDERRAWRLANTLLTWTVIVLLVVAIVIATLAEPLIGRLVAPELSADGRALAVDLTRLLLVSPLLLGLGAAAKGMLEAQDAFTLPAVAPVLYNLGIIGGALLLVPSLGAYGLVTGVLIGAFAHVLVQTIGLVRRGMRFQPVFDLHADGVGKVARLMAPRVFGQVAGQSNLIVMTNLASRLGEGSISAMNYANALVLLPHGILAMSLSTVMFPRLARQFALGERAEMRQTLLDGVRPLIFLVLPVTVLLLAFRTSIVQVLFQYGSFTAESTDLVALAVGILGVSLLARSLIEPITRAFYAMHDTRTPVAISVGSVFVNIWLSLRLSQTYGLAGLAWGLSLTYVARLLVLVGVLSMRVDGVWSELGRTFWRLVAPAVISVVLAVVLMDPVAAVTDPADGRSVFGYLMFVGALLICGGAYLGVAWLMRVPELNGLLRVVERRLGRRRLPRP